MIVPQNLTELGGQPTLYPHPRLCTHDPRLCTHDPRLYTHDPRPGTHDPRLFTHDPRLTTISYSCSTAPEIPFCECFLFDFL